MYKKIPKRVKDHYIEEGIELVEGKFNSDSEGDLLTKLIKHDRGEVIYCTIWKEGGKLIVYTGKVGDIGEKNEIQLSFSQQANELKDELVTGKLNEGFRYLKNDDFTDLIVEYSHKEDDYYESLSKRVYLQFVLDGCLFWSGNGYGVDVETGMGVSQIFNYVIDVDKAVQVIIEELETEKLHEGIEISYYESEIDTYITLYQSN